MQTRRRIDQVLEDGFADDLSALSLDDVRERRQMAHEVENELSYYRRILHGRMDLIRFELRRRTGEETRSLIEALPHILADDVQVPMKPGRHIATDLPMLPDVGKREIDQVLGDDVLTRLDRIDEDELKAALSALEDVEGDYSERRRTVQKIEDVLATELADRYRAQSG